MTKKTTSLLPEARYSGPLALTHLNEAGQPSLIAHLLFSSTGFRSLKSQLRWKVKPVTGKRTIPRLLANPLRHNMPLQHRLEQLNALRDYLLESSFFSTRPESIPHIDAEKIERTPFSISALLPTPVACDGMPISMMTGYRKMLGMGRPSGTFIGFSLK